MSRLAHSVRPQSGDRIEVRGLSGTPPRTGVISEVLGAGQHEHYRVRWDEEHESLFFPEAGEGVRVVHPDEPGRGAGG